MNGQVLRAMQGLSDVLYRGQRDIGQSRLAQARFGLEEAKTKYDIETGQQTRKLRGLQMVPLEEQVAEIQARQTAQQEPFSIERLGVLFDWDDADMINFGSEIEKRMKDLGATRDKTTNLWTYKGKPVDMSPGSPALGIVGMVADPIRELESRAERNDPAAKTALADPKQMIAAYEEQREFLRQIEGAPWMNTRLKEVYKNKIADTEEKIKRLEKEIPTAVQKAQLGLLGYKTETAKKAEARSIREHKLKTKELDLKIKKLQAGVGGSANVQLLNYLQELGIETEEAVNLALRFKKMKSDTDIYTDTYQALIKGYADMHGEQPPKEQLAQFDQAAQSVVENVRKMRPELIKKKREKGLGYFGKLKRPDGNVSTELSIGVNIDGKEIEIPSLVPTLTQEEIDYLLGSPIDNIPVREPHPSELEYFKKNPNVTGMAAEDNSVILNPFSSLSKSQKEAVIKNEKARIYMRSSGTKPDFKLTDKQRKLFIGYGTEEEIKETIAARILSKDPSAGDITDEQVKWVDDNLKTNKPTKQIVNKAVEHAKKRMAEGKTPFAQRGEQLSISNRLNQGEIRRRYKEARDMGYSPEVSHKMAIGKKRGGVTGGF